MFTSIAKEHFVLMYMKLIFLYYISFYREGCSSNYNGLRPGAAVNQLLEHATDQINN